MAVEFMELDFKVGDVHLLTVGFGQAKGIMTNWRAPFKEMYQEYAAYEERVFASEGSAGLGKWAPLSPIYAKWKAIHFPGRPILTRTGRMRAAAKTLILLTEDRLVMGPGNMVPYAVYHEMGWGQRRRPFIQPNQTQIIKYREIARKHMIEARKAAKQASQPKAPNLQ